MQIPIPEIVMTWQFWLTAVIVYILCEIFKQIPLIKDGECGWLVNGFGVIVGALILCLLMGFSWENCIFGILASAASTLAYEIWRNILNSVVGKKETIPAQNVEVQDVEERVGGTD